MCPTDIFCSWFGPPPLEVADHCCKRSNKWALFSLAGYSFFLVCDTVPSICWGNWTLVFPYETGAVTTLPRKCWVLSLCISRQRAKQLVCWVKRHAVKTCRCGTIHFYPQPYTEPSASSSGDFTYGERVSSTHSLGGWKESKPVKM